MAKANIVEILDDFCEQFKIDIDDIAEARLTYAPNGNRMFMLRTFSDRLYTTSNVDYDDEPRRQVFAFDNISDRQSRAKAVRNLIAKGFTQTKIALMLGISQPQVSMLKEEY